MSYQKVGVRSLMKREISIGTRKEKRMKTNFVFSMVFGSIFLLCGIAQAQIRQGVVSRHELKSNTEDVAVRLFCDSKF